MRRVVVKRASRRVAAHAPRVRARETARRARDQAYRAIVLDAAERVFADHGFEATRIQDIAAAAGVSVGTIYGLFPGKTELFEAVHEARLAEILAHARETAGRSSGTLDTLLDGMGGYLRYLMAHPNYLRMHLREGNAWALGHATSSTGARAWQEGIALEAALLRKGIDEGLLVDEDPMLLAKLTTAMHQVLLAGWVEAGMKTPPEDVVARMRRLFRQAFVLPDASAAGGAAVP